MLVGGMGLGVVAQAVLVYGVFLPQGWRPGSQLAYTAASIFREYVLSEARGKKDLA